jgi:hypothetical protein
VYTPNLCYVGKPRYEDCIQAGLGLERDVSQKYPTLKGLAEFFQVVEHLPNKHKACTSEKRYIEKLKILCSSNVTNTKQHKEKML